MLAENPDDVHAGAANLRRQIDNIRAYGVTPVVAVNAFPGDLDSEKQAIMDIAESEGVRGAVCTHFTRGGKGAVDLAEAVMDACAEPTRFCYLYPDDLPLADKIDLVARRMYGADGIELSPTARRQLESYERCGFGSLPVCIAKTHLSLSADPGRMGVPTGWLLPVREIRASVGAGFIYPICGEMRTMPGLSSHPAAERIDIDEAGQVVGLS
jgi:formate--tetrahydrofolate ligase